MSLIIIHVITPFDLQIPYIFLKISFNLKDQQISVIIDHNIMTKEAAFTLCTIPI